ncbi:MAG: universal stress protein [Deltaproteobacteria bacterium]|nr:universal stress protein [Deltaproteobacteria bacterium]
MVQKKILVPIGQTATNLKSVHYALALADRLGARIIILQQALSSKAENRQAAWFHESLQDLINNARKNDMLLSHYMANTNFKDEIVDLVRVEHIDLLVFCEDGEVSESLLFQIKPLVPSQIIQVREKNEIHCIKEGDEAYGTCHDIQPVPGGAGGVGPGFSRKNRLADAHPRGPSGKGKAAGDKGRPA